MEIPGKVSLYCPLLDAKGTPAQLISVQSAHYHVEVTIKGRTHAVLVPIAQTALLFSEPEPPREEGFEIER